jgi:non-specific protein-tyrosine kinase
MIKIKKNITADTEVTPTEAATVVEQQFPLSPALPEEEPHTRKMHQEPGAAFKEKPGWFSPVYHQSRLARLDPGRVTDNRCLAFLPESRDMDSYRVLRTRIQQQTRRPGGVTVLVTSASPEEGKTLTAINLSLAFAQDFQQTVLLVDCDIRKQQVCEKLGFAGHGGIVDYLLREVPLSELIVWPGIEKITVISGGEESAAGAELLGSPRMRTLIEDVRSRYPERYVFFDGPSLLAGADALHLVPLVDFVLVVVRAGKTAIDDVRKAVGMIPPEKMLGMVLNRVNEKS